jgi:hypothetical protein
MRSARVGHLTAASACVLAAATLAFATRDDVDRPRQVRPGSSPPGQIVGSPTGLPYEDPEHVPLDELAWGGQRWHRKNVTTRGLMLPLGATRYGRLSDGGAQVLLIPMPEIAEQVNSFYGRRVELTGISRVVPEHQQVLLCGPESLCDDPQLPPLPDRRPEYPQMSITVTQVMESAERGRGSKGAPAASLDELIDDAAALAGTTVRVVGLFRGRNLYGDLPAGSEREPSAWVLKDEDRAVWVLGKRPEGKGWKLDPAYRGDTVRWLEVTGKLEVVNGVGYLRASKVMLTTAPATATEDR